MDFKNRGEMSAKSKEKSMAKNLKPNINFWKNKRASCAGFAPVFSSLIQRIRLGFALFRLRFYVENLNLNFVLCHDIFVKVQMYGVGLVGA